MEIGPMNPVVKQFRMNTWSPDAADNSAKNEAFARNTWSDGTKVGFVMPKAEMAPDADRPAHKLRQALSMPSIPPVTVELPEASFTRPSPPAGNTPVHDQGQIAKGALPGLPLGGAGGTTSGRPTPPNGSISQGAFGASRIPNTLPSEPGPLTLGRPQIPVHNEQLLRESLAKPLSTELPETGPLSQNMPRPPESKGLNAPGIQSYSEMVPRSTSPLPPLPLADPPEAKTFEDGSPRSSDDNADVTQTRARIKKALANRAAVLEENLARRAQDAENRSQQIQARVAREAAAPPAHGAEAQLITPHVEPPFDPEARASLSVEPRQERGRVARKDSVLYDQVGAQRRVERSSVRADESIDRQRDIGRRAFEVRQRRNADAVKVSEARNESRRLDQLQMLEAAERQDIAERAEVRKQNIARELNDQLEVKTLARQNFYDISAQQSDTFSRLVSSAQQARTNDFKANVGSRASAVKERQREVFELQMQFAEERQFVEENPLNVVGDEALRNIELSRTGNEKFKSFATEKVESLERQQEVRADKVADRNQERRARNDEGFDKARERSQNVRRRLTSTYRRA